jgi:NAD(P)H-flavin reductase
MPRARPGEVVPGSPARTRSSKESSSAAARETFTLDPMAPQVGCVRARRRESPGVWTLDIDMGGAPAAPRAEPGQFNMLMAFDVGEAAISLSAVPAAGSRLVHTIRAVGPVSSALTMLKRGDPVGVRGPFGVGWPIARTQGRDVLIIAGGLGLAPLRPALHSLLAERERYGRIRLLYGARGPDDILYRRELEDWGGGQGAEVEVTVDHAPPGWSGHVGVVTTLLGRAGFDPDRTTALLCGPEIMMRFCIAALQALGLKSEAIFLAMERNMKCAIGHCGHCQFGTVFVCRDGPVFRLDQIEALLTRKEI